jgi:hypothetical protein
MAGCHLVVRIGRQCNGGPIALNLRFQSVTKPDTHSSKARLHEEEATICPFNIWILIL